MWYCLLILILQYWTPVHGTLYPCAEKPWAPYWLNDKCVECLHHCDCPNLGDYCSKEGIISSDLKNLS